MTRSSDAPPPPPSVRRPSVRRLVSLVCLALVGAGALVSGGCERRHADAPSPEADTTLGPTPSQVSWDARFLLSKSGKRRAVITAEKMLQFETDSTYSVLHNPTWTDRRVRAHVFDEAGDSSAVITADSVVFLGREGRFEAYGDVVVVTQEGKRLYSEQLTWLQADRSIRTRRFVRIVTPTERVQGNGLVADEDLATYQIGRFTAEVEVEEDS